jgi:hypothetical protein
MPTFKSSQLQAFTLTEKEQQRIWALILKDYTAAYKAIDADLARVYAQVLAGVPKEQYYATMLKYNRLNSLLNQVQEDYTKWSIKAGRKSVLSSEIGITNNYYRNLYRMDWFGSTADFKIGFSVLDPNLVEQSVLGTTESWQAIQKETFRKVWGDPLLYQPGAVTLSETLVSNRAGEIAKIRQSITSGLVQGKSYRQISNDVFEIIGKRSVEDGVISYSGAKYNALRVVRTEGTRNLNAGALANTNHARSQGIDIRRAWDATLDGTTRRSHGRLDGTFENENGFFFIGDDFSPYPGRFQMVKNNVNCRCSVNDFVDGIPPRARAGINPVTGEREVFDWKDYDQWTEDNGLKYTAAGLLVPV